MRRLSDSEQKMRFGLADWHARLGHIGLTDVVADFVSTPYRSNLSSEELRSVSFNPVYPALAVVVKLKHDLFFWSAHHYGSSRKSGANIFHYWGPVELAGLSVRWSPGGTRLLVLLLLGRGGCELRIYDYQADSGELLQVQGSTIHLAYHEVTADLWLDDDLLLLPAVTDLNRGAGCFKVRFQPDQRIVCSFDSRGRRRLPPQADLRGGLKVLGPDCVCQISLCRQRVPESTRTPVSNWEAHHHSVLHVYNANLDSKFRVVVPGVLLTCELRENLLYLIFRGDSQKLYENFDDMPAILDPEEYICDPAGRVNFEAVPIFKQKIPNLNYCFLEAFWHDSKETLRALVQDHNSGPRSCPLGVAKPGDRHPIGGMTFLSVLDVSTRTCVRHKSLAPFRGTPVLSTEPANFVYSSLTERQLERDFIAEYCRVGEGMLQLTKHLLAINTFNLTSGDAMCLVSTVGYDKICTVDHAARLLFHHPSKNLYLVQKPSAHPFLIASWPQGSQDQPPGNLEVVASQQKRGPDNSVWICTEADQLPESEEEQPSSAKKTKTLD